MKLYNRIKKFPFTNLHVNMLSVHQPQPPDNKKVPQHSLSMNYDILMPRIQAHDYSCPVIRKGALCLYDFISG